MKLLYLSRDDSNFAAWNSLLAGARPDDVMVRADGETVPDGSFDVAFVHSPPPGYLKQVPGLKALVALGAGVDDLWRDPELPDIPIVRMANGVMISAMLEYIEYAVLRYHRNFDRIERLQQNGQWEWQAPTPRRDERRVGVLGLGNLGGAAASMLADMGFDVIGWSRTAKSISGVECHHGEAGLAQMVARAEILISLLPLTPDTRGLLNADLFARMPAGAAIINVGRGAQINDADLIAALDAGQLRGATLDVFD